MVKKPGALTPSDLHPANEVWATVVREFREARGLSLTAEAALTGLCWQAIQKIEERNCRPRLDSLLRICDAMEVPFIVVALVVELRREGCVVPIARVFRLLRAERRIFLKIVHSAPSAPAGG